MYMITKKKKKNLPRGIPLLEFKKMAIIMKEVLSDWIPVTALLKRRAFLASYSFKWYFIPKVKNKTASLNSDLVVIPANMTSHTHQ